MTSSGAGRVERLRVLVVSDLYPPHYEGGYELLCEEVAERLAGRGHRIEVLTSRHGIPRPRIEGHVRRMLSFRGQATAGLLRRQWHDNRLARRIVAEVAPDVISVWNAGGLTKSILYTLQASTVPVAYFVHDDWLARQFVHDPWLCLWKPGRAGGLRRAVKRLIARPRVRALLERIAPTGGHLDLSHVAFISDYRRVQAMAAGLPVTASRVIYGAIDLDRFVLRRPRRSERPLRVLFAGRLVPDKGLDLALATVEALLRRRPGACVLDVVGAFGDPGYEGGIRREIDARRLTEHVRFLGRVARESMPEIYAAHDCLLFTSTTEEGFPLVVLEAMACGLVVVGGLAGGTGEILRDGANALVTALGTPELLADRVERLVSEPGLFDRLSAAGEASVQPFYGLRRLVDEVELFLREAAARRPASSPGSSAAWESRTDEAAYPGPR